MPTHGRLSENVDASHRAVWRVQSLVALGLARRGRLRALRRGETSANQKAAGAEERGGQDRRDQGRPARAARHPDDGRPAGDDPGVRSDADLFADLRLRRRSTGTTSATASRPATS